MDKNSFVCNTVLTYLEDTNQMMDNLEAMQSSIDLMARPAETALQGLEAIVGMGDDWEYSHRVCSRFQSIQRMLWMAGAMLGQEELCRQYHQHELECQKW